MTQFINAVTASYAGAECARQMPCPTFESITVKQAPSAAAEDGRDWYPEQALLVNQRGNPTADHHIEATAAHGDTKL